MKTEFIPFLLSFKRCQSVTEFSNAALSRAVDRAALSPSNDSAACLAREILADAAENPEWRCLPVTAECGSQLAQAFASGRPEVKRTKQAFICGKVREVTLELIPAGYVIAGSCLRLQPAPVYAVRWHDGRATQGRQHKLIASAVIDFDSYKEAPAPAAR